MDIISSASTDRIDFIMSSASSKDNRFWLAAGYQKGSKDNKTAFWCKTLLCHGIRLLIMGDYPRGGLVVMTLNNWRYGVNAQLFADDLRWGRLNDDFRRPVTVVYPVELRDSVWFDIYMPLYLQC